jgi:hypothetical protein
MSAATGAPHAGSAHRARRTAGRVPLLGRAQHPAPEHNAADGQHAGTRGTEQHCNAGALRDAADHHRVSHHAIRADDHQLPCSIERNRRPLALVGHHPRRGEAERAPGEQHPGTDGSTAAPPPRCEAEDPIDAAGDGGQGDEREAPHGHDLAARLHHVPDGRGGPGRPERPVSELRRPAAREAPGTVATHRCRGVTGVVPAASGNRACAAATAAAPALPNVATDIEARPSQPSPPFTIHATR